MAVDPQSNARTICFLITSLFKGGAETQLVRLAIGLHNRGWKVSIVTLIDRNDFAEILTATDIEIETLGLNRGRYDPRSVPQLIRILRRRKPMLLCTFMYHANVLGRVAGKLSRVPFVVSSIRNSVFGGRLAEILMRSTDMLANVTTTNSALAADALLSRRVVGKGRLKVIPNAIEASTTEVQPYPDRTQITGSATAGAWLWLSIGRLEPQKAHDLAIRAIGALVAKGMDVQLAIAGSGSLEPRLRSLVKELDLSQKVIFLGYRDDIPELMRTADGIVMSSLWEGLPNVVMEAALLGIPVVATSVGGVTEIITDGKSGVVVQPGDAALLAAGMEHLMHLPAEIRQGMAAAAQAHVLKTFGRDQVLDVWEQTFCSLIDR